MEKNDEINNKCSKWGVETINRDLGNKTVALLQYKLTVLLRKLWTYNALIQKWKYRTGH